MNSIKIVHLTNPSSSTDQVTYRALGCARAKNVCAFSHITTIQKDSRIKLFEDEIKALKDEIKALKTQNRLLEEKVLNISKEQSKSAHFEVKTSRTSLEKELTNSKCDLCKKIIAYEINLKHHVEKSHNPGEIKVVNADKNIASSNEHAGENTSYRNYIEMNNCEKCHKIFITRIQLNEHVKLHCSHCNQVFANLLQLKKHETQISASADGGPRSRV